MDAVGSIVQFILFYAVHRKGDGMQYESHILSIV